MSLSSPEAKRNRGFFNKEKSVPTKHSRSILVILSISTLIYGVFWSYVSISKLLALNATVFDLGIAAQRGWVILHTHLSLLTYIQTLFDSGIVFPLSPLTATGNYPLMLIFQAFSIAIVSPALYKISRLLGIGKGLSLIISLSFFLYFPTYGIFWFDFHYQVFFLPLFIFGYMLYLEKSYKGALLLFFLSGIVRYPYSIFPLAFSAIEILQIYQGRKYGIDRKRLHAIIALLVLMLIWTLTGYILMGLSGPIAFSGVPIYGINQQGLFPRLFAIILFLAPLMFLPLLSARWIVFTIPAFFLILFSSNAAYTYHLIMQGQYVAGIVPFTLLGFIDSLSLLSKSKPSRKSKFHHTFTLEGKRRILGFLTSFFVVLVVLNSIFAPFGSFNQNSSDSFNFQSSTNFNLSQYSELSSMINMIPATDPYVAYQNNLPQILPRSLPFGTSLLMGGYLGDLANFNSSSSLNNSWPIYFNNGKILHVPIDYAIADASNQYFYQQPNSMYNLSNTMFSTGQYGILSEGYGLILLKQGYSGPIKNYVSGNRTLAANNFENKSGPNSGFLPIVKTNDTSDNFMFYGPGTYLFPGSYNITFYLKTNNMSFQNNIWLQITYNSGSSFLAFEHINGTWFKSTGKWNQFSFHLNLNNIYGKVEFRGYGIKWNGTLEFNGVRVIQENAYVNSLTH